MITAAILAMALGDAAEETLVASPESSQKATVSTSGDKKKRAGRKYSYPQKQYFLLPVTKQKFKQNRRKELKKSSRKKSK